jgi:hypothetical protein
MFVLELFTVIYAFLPITALDFFPRTYNDRFGQGGVARKERPPLVREPP